MSFSDLPTLNAILNSTSAILLLIGHRFMKQGNITAHKRAMIGVFVVSAMFLTSYLVYHYGHGSQPFKGEGIVRPIYFAILISHTILATAIVPLAIITLVRGLKGRYESHKRIARWTYPIWLYVSATGVIIYLMLYHLFTGA
jgi:putative membrane protein